MILVTCCHSTNHTACYCGRDPNGKREFAYNLPKQEINTLDKWESFNTTLKCARIAFFFLFFAVNAVGRQVWWQGGENESSTKIQLKDTSTLDLLKDHTLVRHSHIHPFTQTHTHFSLMLLSNWWQGVAFGKMNLHWKLTNRASQTTLFKEKTLGAVLSEMV